MCFSGASSVEEGVQQGVKGYLKPFGEQSPCLAYQLTAQRPCVRGRLRQDRRKWLCAVDGRAQVDGLSMARRCLLPWDCLSSYNLCPVLGNSYKQSKEEQIVTWRIFFYVLAQSFYILGSLAGTNGHLSWAAFTLQGCGPVEMMKCFHSCHQPQLEHQRLLGSPVSPAEQAWCPCDVHFSPCCIGPVLKPTAALEHGLWM